MPDDDRGLDAGGTGATAYAEAVSVYLGICVSTSRPTTINSFALGMQRTDSHAHTFRTAGDSDDVGFRRGESVCRSRRQLSSDRSNGSRVLSTMLASATVTGIVDSSRCADSDSISEQSSSPPIRRTTTTLATLICPTSSTSGCVDRLRSVFPDLLRHDCGAKGRRTGCDAVPSWQQREGRGVLPRRHDAGDAQPRRAGAPGRSDHNLLRLQAVRNRERGRHIINRLGDLS